MLATSVKCMSFAAVPRGNDGRYFRQLVSNSLNTLYRCPHTAD